MRAVQITCKLNINKINEIGNEAYKAVRKHLTKLDEAFLMQSYQMAMLRNLYVIGLDYVEANTSLFLSELSHKIQGYKGQDLKKELHDPLTLIRLTEVVEKLVAAQLNCSYCSKPVFVLYKQVRDPMQWTLDRIDNALGHTSANTCVACLKCNLQRRVMDADKFTFTKKLKIQKL